MGIIAKGAIIFRISRALIYLSDEPRTMKELARELGIRKWGANAYISMFKKAGYPIRWRERVLPGTGVNPREFWLAWSDPIMWEAMRILLELRKLKLKEWKL